MYAKPPVINLPFITFKEAEATSSETVIEVDRRRKAAILAGSLAALAAIGILGEKFYGNVQHNNLVSELRQPIKKVEAELVAGRISLKDVSIDRLHNSSYDTDYLIANQIGNSSSTGEVADLVGVQYGNPAPPDATIIIPKSDAK